MCTTADERKYFMTYVNRYRSNRHDLARKQRVVELVKDTKASAILDLGCGVGAFSYALRSIRPQRFVVSTDISADALHCARLVGWGQDSVRSNAVKMPFRDASFDLVLLVEVIEHIRDQEALFTGLYRAIRPEGLLLLTTSPLTSCFLYPVIRKLRHSKVIHPALKPFDLDEHRHVAMQHPSELLKRLRMCGFSIQRAIYWNTLQLSYIFANLRIKWLRRLWGTANTIDRWIAGPILSSDIIIVARRAAGREPVLGISKQATSVGQPVLKANR